MVQGAGMAWHKGAERCVLSLKRCQQFDWKKQGKGRNWEVGKAGGQTGNVPKRDVSERAQSIMEWMKVGRTSIRISAKESEANWSPEILRPHIPQTWIFMESQDGSNIWAGYSLNYMLRQTLVYFRAEYKIHVSQLIKWTYLKKYWLLHITLVIAPHLSSSVGEHW